MFKIPKPWLDRTIQLVFEAYAANIWQEVLKTIEKAKIDNRLLKLYIEYENEEGDLEKFHNDLSLDPDVWRSKLLELTPEDKLKENEEENSIYIEPTELGWHKYPSHEKDKNSVMSFVLTARRLEDDLYSVNVLFPSEDMATSVFNEAKTQIDNPKQNLIGGLKEQFFKDNVDFEGSLEQIVNSLVWLSSNIIYVSYLPFLTNYMESINDMDSTDLVDFMRIIKECKKYANSPSDNINDIVTEELDLFYLIDDLRALPEYFEGLDLERYSRLIYKGLLNLGWPKKIPVKIFMNTKVLYEEGGAQQQSMGLWDPNTKEISISFILKPNNIKVGITFDIFQKSLENALDAIRHELSHMAQSIIKDIKDLDEVAGLPSKSIRDPKTNIHGISIDKQAPTDKEHHSLRDIEFYTDLTDAVNEFNRLAKNLTSDLKTEYAKRFVGEPDNLDELVFRKMYPPDKQEQYKFDDKSSLTYQYTINWFFKKLREKNIKKWRIAVREFVKATQ